MAASEREQGSKEIELKLEFDPGDAARIKSHPLLAAERLHLPEEQDLISVYFDTPDLALSKAGVFLRVRECGGRYRQTVKVMKSKTDLLERFEWEKEISGRVPELEAVDGTALQPLLTSALGASLRPLFETRMRRTLHHIARGGSEVEVAVDEGEIVAGARKTSICEVELELKGGEKAELFRLARSLDETVPLRLAVKTKSERGFELLSQADFAVEKAGDLDIKSEVTTADAFRTIARSCLRQIIVNEQAMSGGHAEALHQMRVGLRRLRAAISIFADVLVGSGVDSIKAEMRWITQELGPARDLDVFAADVLKPLQDARPYDAAVGAAYRDFEERRKAAYARAAGSVRSGRFRTALLDLAEWVEVGDWGSAGEAASGSIAEHAAKELARLRKQINKRGRDLRHRSSQQRHKLRIRAKRLRYATEYFASTFPGERNVKRRAELLSALKDLQDALGGLNDLETRHGLMSGGAGADATETKAAAIPDPASEEAARERLLAAAERAFARFAEAKAFWKD